MIRNTKKDLIMNEVMNEYLEDSQRVNLIPGEISFVKILVQNDTNTRQAYRV